MHGFRFILLALYVVLLVFSTVVTAEDMSSAQLVRYHGLTAQLRCLVCQNRSIAESDAPLAADLRGLVATQIKAGRSDRQIKRYLVDRYGNWVLYDPPFNYATWLLWLGPFLLLLIALAVALSLIRKRHSRRSPAPTLDRERLAAVLEADDSTQRTRRSTEDRADP